MILYCDTSSWVTRCIDEDGSDVVGARKRFALDWPQCLVLEVTQPLVELAGGCAEAFALRAYDSLQLASAQVLRQHSGEELRFGCFDQHLRKAPAVLGLAGL